MTEIEKEIAEMRKGKIKKLFADIEQLVDFDDDRIAKGAKSIIESFEAENTKLKENLEQAEGQRDTWRKKYLKSVSGEEVKELEEKLEIAIKALKYVAVHNFGAVSEKAIEALEQLTKE